MDINTESFDELVNSIKNDQNLPKGETQEKPDVNKDNVQSYILDKMGEACETAMEGMKSAQRELKISADVENIMAFAKMVDSVAKLFDVVNKTPLQQDKIEGCKEIAAINGVTSIKSAEIENKKIPATREEILAIINGKDTDKIKPDEIIDVSEDKESNKKALKNDKK